MKLLKNTLRIDEIRNITNVMNKIKKSGKMPEEFLKNGFVKYVNVNTGI